MVLAFGNATEPSIRFGESGIGCSARRRPAGRRIRPDGPCPPLHPLPGPGLRGIPRPEDRTEIEQVLASRSDPQSLGALDDVHGLVALLEGRMRMRSGTSRALPRSTPSTPRSRCALAGRAAVWNRSAADWPAALQALDATGVHRPALEASRMTLRAGLTALEGRPSDALSLYRESLGAWRGLGLVWDEALCGIDMATVLDPSSAEVRAAADQTREILVRLGARPSCRCSTTHCRRHARRMPSDRSVAPR